MVHALRTTVLIQQNPQAEQNIKEKLRDKNFRLDPQVASAGPAFFKIQKYSEILINTIKM